MKAAGVTGVISKLGGSNNLDYPLYLETVHQDAAREVFGTCWAYWANGPAGTPEEIAKRIVGSGQVRAGERMMWDIEDWPEEDVVAWSPAEVEARALALAVESETAVAIGQLVYMGSAHTQAHDWARIVDLGIPLVVANYDDGPCLVHHWRKGGILYRQYTSSSNPAIRAVYDADLDLNREPYDVWTVEELQAALNVAMPDLEPLEIDNDYGRMTRSRVTTLQERSGGKLVVDGDAGRRTLATLTKPE